MNISRYVKIIYVVDFSELRTERLIYKCLHLRQVHLGYLFNIFPLPAQISALIISLWGSKFELSLEASFEVQSWCRPGDFYFQMMYHWHKNMLIWTDVHTDVKNQYFKKYWNIDKYIE